MIFFLPLAVFLVSLLAGFFPRLNVVVDPEPGSGYLSVSVCTACLCMECLLFFHSLPGCVTSIKCNQKKIYKRHE